MATIKYYLQALYGVMCRLGSFSKVQWPAEAIHGSGATSFDGEAHSKCRIRQLLSFVDQGRTFRQRLRARQSAYKEVAVVEQQ